ncbi:MAG: cupredoxin family copper-binding protein [Sphingopyxis sp.]|nr:cupredoxin family copper-binding protein [Sphingopyxis sp.]
MNGVPTERSESGGRTRGLLRLTATLLPVVALMLGYQIDTNDSAWAKEQSVTKTHMVEIRQFKFYPATLQVKRGDIVVWKNIDAAPHTATSTKWDSGKLNRNQSWSLKINSKGNIEYVCTYHPMMKGKIIAK